MPADKMDKKGVSLMVGYVLLVVIAIGLSVAVFAYLKLYLPKEGPKCYDDVAISIDSVSCSAGKLNLTLNNRGLFNINGAFIRIGEQGRVFKENIGEQHGRLFVGDGEQGARDGFLNPGEEWFYEYDYIETGNKELEVEPFLYLENEAVLCEKAVVSKNVVCS